jgi:hypothetical protein
MGFVFRDSNLGGCFLIYHPLQGNNMKQKKLITKVYEACVAHNTDAIAKLRKLEFAKIIKRKEKHKPFNNKWTVINI